MTGDEHLWDLFDDVATVDGSIAQQPDSDEVPGGMGQMSPADRDNSVSLDDLVAPLPEHWTAAIRAVVAALVADQKGAGRDG